jgi:hypothetical protein
MVEKADALALLKWASPNRVEVIRTAATAPRL